MAAQLEITLTKADSEQLARSIAEEQYSDLEKEKIMKELEIKEMMARHKQELTEKDATIASVSNKNYNFGRCLCEPEFHSVWVIHCYLAYLEVSNIQTYLTF